MPGQFGTALRRPFVERDPLAPPGLPFAKTLNTVPLISRPCRQPLVLACRLLFDVHWIVQPERFLGGSYGFADSAVQTTRCLEVRIRHDREPAVGRWMIRPILTFYRSGASLV